MVCREDLFRSIHYAHTALVAYSRCIDDKASSDEKAVFEQIGLELAEQLKVLRNLLVKLYGVDPLHSHDKTGV